MNILITGASSGLGAALSRKYAKKGNHLFLIARNEERLNVIKNECETKGAITSIFITDITDTHYKNTILDISKNIEFDLVFANAGINVLETFENNPQNKFAVIEKIMNTNFLAQLQTIFPLIEGLKKTKGKIVIISSLNALFGVPHDPAYSAAKAALFKFFEGFRPTLRKQGITTTIVLPGFIDTPMSKIIDSPKPFRMSAEKAATLIQRAVKKKKPVVIFPKRLHLIIIIVKLLPTAIIDKLLCKF